MRAILVAAGAGLAMGVAAGLLVRLQVVEREEVGDVFQTAAFAEDPGVELHRLAMGAEPWGAPQPFIRITYPPITEAPPIPELADLTLADLDVRPSSVIDDRPELASAETNRELAGAKSADQPMQISAVYQP